MKKKLLVILGAGSTFFCGLSSVDELDLNAAIRAATNYGETKRRSRWPSGKGVKM